MQKRGFKNNNKNKTNLGDQMTTTIKKQNDYILSSDFGNIQWLSIGDLKVDESYQRLITPAHVKDISENIDLAAFGVLIINRRTWDNNDLYVVDGMHRVKALFKAGKTPEFAVPCIVLELKSAIEESILFTKLNVKKRNLSALERFWPRILQKVPVSTGVLKVTQETGFEIPKQYLGKAISHTLTNRLVCIETLEKVYIMKDNGDMLKEVLSLIYNHWSNMSENSTANLISGLARFINVYENTKFLSMDHLNKVMSKITPKEIVTYGKKTTGISLTALAGGKRGGGQLWALFFIHFYNNGVGNDRKIGKEEITWLSLSKTALKDVKKRHLNS